MSSFRKLDAGMLPGERKSRRSTIGKPVNRIVSVENLTVLARLEREGSLTVDEMYPEHSSRESAGLPGLTRRGLVVFDVGADEDADRFRITKTGRKKLQEARDKGLVPNNP
jgi:hypothetical protein